MISLTAELKTLLQNYPDITIAAIDDTRDPPTLVIYRTSPYAGRPINLPTALSELTLEVHYAAPLRLMWLGSDCYSASNPWNVCQDEPIKLGTQIQPRAMSWVGTAGAPVSWTGPDNIRRWGLLSNAHVMVPSNEELDWPQHQPNDRLPAIAHLSAFTMPRASGDNRCDAAIADALIDGHHTIARELVGVGPLRPEPVNALPGLAVTKCGRTTGIVNGTCRYIGASVKVSYGLYTATLNDQDVFQGHSASMSEPGDSGSLIFTRDTRQPASLLFAGDGTLTIGSPIRYITQQFNLSFQL